MRRRDDPLHLPTLPNQGFGELDADLSRLLATETGDTTSFAVHSDSAPTYYVTGNPAQMAEVTRKLEHHVAALTAFDPIIGTDIPVTARLADQQEQSFLHMVTADPNRTPTFILFGDPDFFLFSSGTTTACTPLSACSTETNGFAWKHDDFQPEITNTWLGLAGPGVHHQGVTGEIFSDHTDIRPTMILLAGSLTTTRMTAGCCSKCCGTMPSRSRCVNIAGRLATSPPPTKRSTPRSARSAR